MPAHLIAEEGPHRGLVLNLEEGEDWIIGRDPDEADFVIEDSTVSRKHARLTRAPEGIYLKNLSRVNPTLVNDEEHEDRVLLKEGDRVQIGNTGFLFSEEKVPDMGATPPSKKEKKKKQKAAYDDIFGDTEPEKPAVEEEAAPVVEEIVEEIPVEKAKVREPTAYDTIFEEGEEELPFNLISEAPLILKVISGPNAGAEIGIDKGRTYIIGKDPSSCDIVFQDLSVSRHHARLVVSSEGTLEIEDLGSKNGTVVNGTPISEKRVVTPQDLIALGTTVFLIIDREAPQETIYSPVVSTYEPPKVEAPVEEPVAEPAKDWKREPIPPKYLIAGASFVVVFLVVFLSFFSLFKSKGVEVVQKEPVDEIKEALAKFKDVQFSYNPGSGKLFLVGHVQTGVEYQEMNYRVGQIPFILATEDNVVIDELVAKTMNDVLNDNAAWRGVSIQVPEAGRFDAVGYIQTNADGVALAEYLTVNFPYLDRLQNKVAIVENLNTQLQSLLTSQSFGAVTMQLTNGDVVLAGVYSDKMEGEYKDLLKQINAIPGVHSVKNFAVATHPNQAGIDLTQQYQVTGSSMFDGRGYSIVLNGKIYTLGDQVDGMKITTIEPNTILLEKDGLKYKIDYTR
ncbi:MAG TPA: type III secretion system inner membrane ring subunit SctD [Chlamydiales bacterium]|nr:type III secretion system inner membrane ring subunit SctD [Chlamydiales bacterium]